MANATTPRAGPESRFRGNTFPLSSSALSLVHSFFGAAGELCELSGTDEGRRGEARVSNILDVLCVPAVLLAVAAVCGEDCGGEKEIVGAVG